MAHAIAAFRAPWLSGYQRLPVGVRETLRWLGWLAFAFAIYTLLLMAYGRDPVQAYSDILSSTLGSTYGISEVLVKMIPDRSLRARGRHPRARRPGQRRRRRTALHRCARRDVGRAHIRRFRHGCLLPISAVLGFAAAGAWAGVWALLRARGWLNEVFSTMLLNYLAVLVVDYLIFGPWRDPTSSNYPQSRVFPWPAGSRPSGTRASPSFSSSRSPASPCSRWCSPTRGGASRLGRSEATLKPPGETGSPSPATS